MNGLRVRASTWSWLLVLPLLGVACAEQPKLLVVGLVGATWKVIDPLMEAGHLPAIHALVRKGVRGEFSCVPAAPAFPCFAPPVWGALATGQPADVHGLDSPYQPQYDRTSPAIWSLLAEHGGSSVVISWFNTWPPDSAAGIQIPPPALSYAAREIYDTWPESQHPGLEDRDHHTSPGWLARTLTVGLDVDGRPPTPGALAADRVAMHNARRIGAWTSRLDAPELTMLVLHGIDIAEHASWGTIQSATGAPIDEATLRAQADAWTGPINGSQGEVALTPASQYLEADRFLAELLETVKYQTVVVLSASGMSRVHDGILTGQHGPSVPEAHFGILIMRGPGIRRGARLENASIFDVAPTLAHLLDLPVADDLPGHVLEEAFLEEELELRPVRSTESW